MINILFVKLAQKLVFASYTSLLWVFAEKYLIILQLNRKICKCYAVN